MLQEVQQCNSKRKVLGSTVDPSVASLLPCSIATHLIVMCPENWIVPLAFTTIQEKIHNVQQHDIRQSIGYPEESTFLWRSCLLTYLLCGYE